MYFTERMEENLQRNTNLSIDAIDTEMDTPTYSSGGNDLQFSSRTVMSGCSMCSGICTLVN